MALGLKTIETRSWYCSHRGPLAIAATKTWNAGVLEWLASKVCDAGRILDALGEAGVPTLGDLPLGAVLCTVEVYDCLPTDDLLTKISVDERTFGDYRLCRFGILTRNIKPFAEPIPCRGKQKLWDWEPEGGANERTDR